MTFFSLLFSSLLFFFLSGSSPCSRGGGGRGPVLNSVIKNPPGFLGKLGGQGGTWVDSINEIFEVVQQIRILMGIRVNLTRWWAHGVLLVWIDDHRNVVDCSDLAGGEVAIVVADRGILVVTFDFVEPAVEDVVQRHGPFLGREFDLRIATSFFFGSLCDRVVLLLHPGFIGPTMCTLSSIHTIRATDVEDLAGFAITEYRIPADSAVATDGIAVGFDPVCSRGLLYGEIERMGVGSRRKTSDVDRHGSSFRERLGKFDDVQKYHKNTLLSTFEYQKSPVFKAF